MPIVGRFGSLAGLGSLILPGGAMESIATVTVGSGGASSIEFTSIPGTYQHLQLRGVLRGTAAATNRSLYWTVNGSGGTNYASHYLYGDGASAAAVGASSNPDAYFGDIPAATASASIFGACVIDLLDYASTSKTKTVRAMVGGDRNGGGRITLASGLWNSTSAVTSFKIILSTDDFAQHSTLALYGVRA